MRRIEREFEEMPGLYLTATQAQRLFGLTAELCVWVLDALVSAKILRRDDGGSYTRRRVQP